MSEVKNGHQRYRTKEFVEVVGVKDDGAVVFRYPDEPDCVLPKEKFEELYEPVLPELDEKFSFSRALDLMKQGHGVRLPGWSEDVVIRAQYPDEHSKMTAPYLYVESRFGRVPWKETMIELFSEEWMLAE